MSQEDEPKLDNVLKYFVNFREKADYSHYEHTYTLPGHKKYYSGYSNPAKYLFTVPPAPSVSTPEYNSANDVTIDVETVDHEPPSFYDYEKLNEQLIDDKHETAVMYDENWIDKIDRKGWNIIKVRLFRTAVQILESDYHSRLTYRDLRDEAVKRHLTSKKTALRFKSLFSTVMWDPPTCQWLHSLLMEKLPAFYVKVYTDAFQCLEAKVPAHFLEHMTISTAYMSVRSRLSGMDSQNSNHKKHWDVFSPVLSQQRPVNENSRIFL